MSSFFYFGEKLKEYPVRVLNEREIRAASGLLFLVAIVTFIVSCMTRNFTPLKIFVVAFMIDFIIRVFINPKFSPTMIFGRLFVYNQVPEYVGAPQKRFAWSIGLAMAITMFFLLFFTTYFGPINMLFCLICLVFLFFETAFGICIGCWLYNLFNKEHAKLCPGGVCEIHKREEITKVPWAHIIILIGFIVLLVLLVNGGIFSSPVELSAGMAASAGPMSVQSGSSPCGGSSGCMFDKGTADVGVVDAGVQTATPHSPCPFHN